MSGFPATWAKANLAELIGETGVFSDGDWIESKDQDPDGDVRLVQLADIGDGVFRNRSARFLTAEKARELNCTFLSPGDLLIARMPDPLGRACVFPGLAQSAVTAVDVCIVRPSSDIDTRWLQHAINAPQFRSAMDLLQSGSTRKRISRGNLATLEIPIAPTQEQRRIREVVDEHVSRLDAAIAFAAQAQSKLAAYRAAVLRVACEGRLVPTNADTWLDAKLGEFLEDIEAGLNFKCEERPPHADEIGLVKISAVTWGRFLEEESKTCPPGTILKPNLLIRPGDFLFSRANTLEKVGACVVVGAVHRTLMLSDKVLRFKLSRRVNAQWLLHYLRAPQGRSEIEALATGNQLSMRNISQESIKAIRIRLPSLVEQRRIVAEVERRLSVVERLEASIDANLARAKRLRQAILKRAFEGRLVPQDPSDEPASALLERIRKEREAAVAAPAAGRRKRKHD